MKRAHERTYTRTGHNEFFRPKEVLTRARGLSWVVLSAVITSTGTIVIRIPCDAHARGRGPGPRPGMPDASQSFFNKVQQSSELIQPPRPGALAPKRRQNLTSRAARDRPQGRNVH